MKKRLFHPNAPWAVALQMLIALSLAIAPLVTQKIIERGKFSWDVLLECAPGISLILLQFTRDRGWYYLPQQRRGRRRPYPPLPPAMVILAVSLLLLGCDRPAKLTTPTSTTSTYDNRLQHLKNDYAVVETHYPDGRVVSHATRADSAFLETRLDSILAGYDAYDAAKDGRR